MKVSNSKIMFEQIDGSGTKQNPYEIETIKQLQAVNQDLSAHYKLVSNINTTNSKRQEFTPIGERTKPFTGTFNGNDYQIENFSIKQPEKDNIGLFTCIGNEGRVKNLGLTNATIQGRYSVGSLVGRNMGKVESCCAVGVDVSGKSYVAGLVGGNSRGEVESSYVKVGNLSFKGLVSRLKQIWSLNSHGADISGDRRVGGLVGWNTGKILSSYVVDGHVLGDRIVGGLVGYNFGKIELCYTVEVDVSGYEFVGGLVGRNLEEVESSYTIRVDISGERVAGGLVGSNYNDGQMESSFVLPKSNKNNVLEESDIVMSRENHRILYIIDTNTLYIQINGEIYSCVGVSPCQVQSLVDGSQIVQITDRFMSSVVKST